MASNPKKIIRVFVDSSVLIAAAISPKGSARDLIMKSFLGELELIVSDLVIEETQKNLTKKAPEALSVLQVFLEALNPKVVIPTKVLIFKVSKVIELKDSPIVAGAISAQADYLVSYDRKHLLQYKKEIKLHFRVNVVTPDELVK